MCQSKCCETNKYWGQNNYKLERKRKERTEGTAADLDRSSTPDNPSKENNQ